ncbi:hypothetical protein LIER_38807 [Lithospermum erythrorhizon]|uniref:Uncharacterized protein n=1 Tax=Lithospermum erythrorhizon TaxID=34254 RepID=A0AAV3Q5Y7_LITER
MAPGGKKLRISSNNLCGDKILNPALYERECPYVITTNPANRQESLATSSSGSSLDDSDTSSAIFPLPQLTVTDKMASKIMPGNNDLTAPLPIKGKMSQSSEHQGGDFVFRPRPEANRAETSISGGMPIIQAEGPLNFASRPQPLDLVNSARVVTAEDVREESARAEEAYQGMMASLPTFVKNSTPTDLTDDQLDGITSYLSIPIEKVDTRLALPREQLYLPRIEQDSTDPDLNFGYTSVYVEAFSYGMRLPFHHS